MCSRSTYWGQISLFIIKEQINDLFLYQCSVFWITLLQVISYCLPKEVCAFRETIFTFLWSTCIWLWGSGFIKALCEGSIQCSSSVTLLRSFRLFGRWRCYFTFIQGTQGRISFWCRFEECHLLKMFPIRIEFVIYSCPRWSCYLFSLSLRSIAYLYKSPIADFWLVSLHIFNQSSISMPPGYIREPKIFWCVQGVKKWNFGKNRLIHLCIAKSFAHWHLFTLVQLFKGFVGTTNKKQI